MSWRSANHRRHGPFHKANYISHFELSTYLWRNSGSLFSRVFLFVTKALTVQKDP